MACGTRKPRKLWFAAIEMTIACCRSRFALLLRARVCVCHLKFRISMSKFQISDTTTSVPTGVIVTVFSPSDCIAISQTLIVAAHEGSRLPVCVHGVPLGCAPIANTNVSSTFSPTALARSLAGHRRATSRRRETALRRRVPPCSARLGGRYPRASLETLS